MAAIQLSGQANDVDTGFAAHIPGGARFLSFVDELDGEFDTSRLVEFHGRVLFWYQYVDVERTNAEIDTLIDAFDPEIIAPAHGLVIRENATEYMAMMKEVTATIDQRGRIGTLG